MGKEGAGELARWEREFLLKLLHLKEENVGMALRVLDKFKGNFEGLVQADREKEGKRTVEARIARKGNKK